jgi:hypothetical protein
MQLANTPFIQEEARLRGAKPLIKAVIYPFELDYGLAAGSGVFENTLYGGEPGKIMLMAGYLDNAAWTSPVRQTFSPFLEKVAVYWESHVSYMQTGVYLRSAASEAEIGAEPYVKLNPGEEGDLAAFFQVKVEFTDSTWSGEPSGYVSGLRLEGRLTLPESDILDPGQVRVELARDFSEHRVGDLALRLDNRQGQWLPDSPTFHFLGLPWEQKRLALYHGWETPEGGVEWLLVYQGVVEGLSGIVHGFRERHRAKLETRDWIAHQLRKRIGVPDSDGTRKPFMRGTYRGRGELAQTTPAEVVLPVKTGIGSASLHILGTYRGRVHQSYLIEAETNGEVGVATFRWSTNQGQSWKETGIVSTGAEDPVELEQGLAVYFASGIGNDLAAVDRFSFTAQAPVYHYQVPGAPFARITTVYLNGEETWEGVEADPETGVILVTGRSAQVEARVVRDNTTHPVDIIMDMLSEVGLNEAIDQDSFALAKSLTPDCAVGICFENVTAARAIRELVQRTLYDLWVDFGEIKIRAYLGE